MFKNVVKEEIAIPAQMRYLRQVRDFIEQIGKKFKFSDKVINSFKLVVDESCTNIIRHGYRDVKNGQIIVRAIVRKLSLTIVLIDHGKSFDPRQVKNPDLQQYVSIGKKGGLGIFMMRKLMDDIKYNVTSNGNELRLTKTREKVDESKPLMLWDSLTLRTKFTLVTCAIMTILAIVSFIIFNSKIRQNIFDEIYTTGYSLSSNLAKISWEPFEDDIVLGENAKSILESQPDLITMVLITDSLNRPKTTSPYRQEIVFLGVRGEAIDFDNKTILDTLDQTTLYRYEITQDSILFDFVTPVTFDENDNSPRGYAHIILNEKIFQEKIQKARINLLLLLLVILVIGYSGSFVLITLIMDPFHKLAGWVRQVGHGTVDEDELDIDASDELGEIAQAFNEMTSKFRNAQVNLMEQQRMQRELQVAQEIQQMLLPDDFPNVIGYDITSYYQAAKEVGGDLFDFVEVDDNTLGICVADVSGKGVPGSMVMTMIRTALRLEARGNKNPSEVLSRVNQFITGDIRKGMFVTAFYIILDSRERMISFASAGHNPMILYRGKTKETFYLNPPGFPVGISLPDMNLFSQTIKTDRIRLHPNDILIAYTDGITEAMNHQRELYGEERFLASIRNHGNLDVVDFVKNVKEDIMNFTGGYEQNDDITLVAFKENMEMVDVKVKMFVDLFEKVKKSKKTVSNICKETGISTSTYYKYKRFYVKKGVEYLREMLHGYTNVGLRHLSIEKKTKIYDIIHQHPEYGAKRISNTLNTAKYGFTKIKENLIYEELKRAKLNKRSQREFFVKRGGKRRLKPPGTPLLTLDGEVMVGFRYEDHMEKNLFFSVPTPPANIKHKEKILSVKSSDAEQSNKDEGDSNNQLEEIPLKDEKTEQNTLEINEIDENEESISEEIDEKERKVD
jgi:serine phosphatase RsbU (regulator of sigma subunit)/anti-sigma regulatory factor (Ser/Thr protein kinase)